MASIAAETTRPAPFRIPRFFLMAVDQGLLSVLTLLVNLVLIRLGTKSEYALFCIITSCILLTQSIQNGSVCTPLVVLGGRVPRTELPGLLRYLKRINATAALVAAAVCAGVTFVVPGAPVRPSWGLAVATAIAVVGFWLREYRRTNQLRGGRLLPLVWSDALVTALAISCLSFLVFRRVTISALGALLTLGLSNLFVSWRVLVPDQDREAPSAEVRREWKGQALLATSGAAVAWLQASSYPIVVAAASGTHAAAEVAASRLFLGPGLLLATAWGRLGLVHATEALRDGGVARWKHYARSQAPRVALGSAAYVLIVGTAVSGGAGKILGTEYQNSALVWCWLVVGFITMVRSVASVVLQAAGDFGGLLRWSAVSAGLACGSVLVLGSIYGGWACILGLGIGELVNGVAFFMLVARKRATPENR